MKICLFLLTMTTWSCNSQTKTYDQAILDCDKKMKEINNQPNTLSTNLFPYCLLGSKIPNFVAYTTDKQKIDASFFKGKVTVINFWLKTCPPCIAEIPGLSIIKDKFKNKKVNFLALGRNSETDTQEFLLKHPWNFDQIKNATEIIDSVFKIKWGYPSTYIVDENMKIVEIFRGGRTDTSAITDIQNKIIPVLERELKK